MFVWWLEWPWINWDLLARSGGHEDVTGIMRYTSTFWLVFVCTNLKVSSFPCLHTWKQGHLSPHAGLHLFSLSNNFQRNDLIISGNSKHVYYRKNNKMVIVLYFPKQSSCHFQCLQCCWCCMSIFHDKLDLLDCSKLLDRNCY